MNNSKIAAATVALLAVGAALQAHAGNIEIHNPYQDKYVWITTYEGGGQLASGCIDPGKKLNWYNPHYQVNTVKIRAEVMSQKACKGTKICDTDMEFKKATQPIYVHQHAIIKDKCYISFNPNREVHRLLVRNTYKDRYVWITSIDYLSGATRKQIHSGCVDPGKERTWHDDRYGEGYVVRAEVMTAAGCKGTKVCDTDGNNLPPNLAKPVTVRQNATNPNNCFIEFK